MELSGYTVDTILRPDIKICQPHPKEGFRFGCDSVILSYFSKLKHKWRVADVGSGSGVIAAIIAKMYGVKVTAIEIQHNMFSYLKKTIELSCLENLVDAVEADAFIYRTKIKFDAVICNPPYRNESTGKVSLDDSERIARFSSKMDMDVLLTFCKCNLKYGGKLFFCYDVDLLIGAINRCKNAGFEVKRLQFVYPSINKNARLVMVECIFGGGESLIVDKPIYQKSGNNITEKYQQILSGNW